jgi:hypothetical protein
MAKSTRKRRKERARAASAARPREAGSEAPPREVESGARPREVAEPSTSARGVSAESPHAAPARGYARGRAKDDAVRAYLRPLRPGERPTAVTVGAVAAGVLALANILAVILGWDGGTDADRGQALAGSLLVTGVLMVVAYGMWQAKYWAVLGLQTLLAITIIFASIGLITAASAWAALLLVAIIAAAGTLFWFMVKAMARIQMPERPGASSRR